MIWVWVLLFPWGALITASVLWVLHATYRMSTAVAALAWHVDQHLSGDLPADAATVLARRRGTHRHR